MAPHRTFAYACGVLLAAALSMGCASGHHRSRAQARGSARGLPGKGAKTTTVLPTVEASDSKLQSALLALAIKPTADAERRVAWRYRELGILDMASDHFSRAVALDRSDSAAYEGLARIWRDWGFPSLGLADANRAVYYAPSSAAAHNTLGTLLAATGLGVEARLAYARALTLDPLAAYALNNLCALSLHEHEPQQAAAECRKALDIDPDLASARVNLARAEAAIH